MLGFAWEQSLQRAFLALPDLVTALNVFYFVGHFLFTGIFFVWLYHRSREGFSRFRDGFLAATAIAVLIHWLYPTAPPLLAGVGLEDTLRILSGSTSARRRRRRSRTPLRQCLTPRGVRTRGGDRDDPASPAPT